MKKEYNLLEDTLIFVSNSELDGFHEGDGDLMDKLTASFNKTHQVRAIRIIENNINVPDDKKALFEKKQLLSLAKEKSLPTEELQRRLLEQVDGEEFSGQKKIFYIGSRINLKGGKVKCLGESGSLFDERLITELKSRNIKIVICCLEYKFFRRSMRQLSRAYEMLKQQLFLADEIHFLTEPDKEDFHLTLDELVELPILKPLPLIEKHNEEKVAQQHKMLEENKSSLHQFETKLEALEESKKACLANIKRASLKEKQTHNIELNSIRENISETKKLIRVERKQLNELKSSITIRQKKLSFKKYTKDYFHNQKEKGVFIPGIYTAEPLDEETIFKLAEQQNVAGTELVEILANREPNILHFGMIRGDKGVDEAIELGKLFEEQELNSRVIIAGKLMLEIGVIKNIFSKIFPIEPSKFYQLLHEELINQEIIPEPLGKRKVRDLTAIEKLIAPNKEHDKFNQFCTSFYNSLQKKYPEFARNIDLHFDVTETELKELAMKCRYAIKLDHKGMANNASTIVSCLGLYLPVFTTHGLMTNKEFYNEELSSRKSIEESTSCSIYSKVVIMPPEEYHIDSRYNELRPVNPKLSVINAFLIEELKSDCYNARLEQLKQLHEDRVFECDHVAERLIKTIFAPLAQALEEKGHQNIRDAEHELTPSF